MWSRIASSSIVPCRRFGSRPDSIDLVVLRGRYPALQRFHDLIAFHGKEVGRLRRAADAPSTTEQFRRNDHALREQQEKLALVRSFAAIATIEHDVAAVCSSVGSVLADKERRPDAWIASQCKELEKIAAAFSAFALHLERHTGKESEPNCQMQKK